MKLSIKDFFSKSDQILRKLRIWSHLLKKSLIENFIFGVVNHFVKSVQIRTYSGLCFPSYGLNMEQYCVSLLDF